MKKIIVFVLTAAMLMALCACGQKPAEEPAQAPAAEDAPAFVLGGWTPAESVALTVPQQELVEKAGEKLLGAEYIPVAYLGSQVVSGRNHAFVCRIAPVTAEAVETFAIVTFYEDLEGKVSLLDVIDSGAETGINDLPGGWAQCEAPTVTKDLQAIFDKALEGYSGMGFKPLALLATQLVSGTNYRFFCESTPVDGGEKGCALVTVYADLNGNAEITEVVPFGA